MTVPDPFAERSDPFADWDAAYVLGALSVADRRAFEEHLAGCPDCRAAVGELAGMPGLLAGLPAAEATALVGPTDVNAAQTPPESVARMRVPGRARRPRLLLVAVVVVALLAGLGAGAVGGYLYRGRTIPTIVRVTFSPVHPSPMSAVAELTSEGSSTRIAVDCTYGAADHGGWSGVSGYLLYAVDSSGQRRQVVGWTSAPGSRTERQQTIEIPLSKIRTLEITHDTTDETLLRATV